MLDRGNFHMLKDLCGEHDKVVDKIKEVFKENPDVGAIKMKVTPTAEKVTVSFHSTGCRCYDPCDGLSDTQKDKNPRELGTKDITLAEAKSIFGDRKIRHYKEYGRSFTNTIAFD